MPLCFGSKEDEAESEFDAIPVGLRWRMRFGKTEKDPNTGLDILRMSGNRHVQTHCESTEYQALKLVDRHTSVPTYKVINVFNRPEGKVVEYEGISGKPLDSIWSGLDQSKKRKIVNDLGRFVEQLRNIESPKHEVVGDSTLGAALDGRFGRAKIGPFYSIDAFHSFIRRGHPTKEFHESSVSACHERPQPYVLKFTHASLCPKNILVDDAGRVNAVIGWQKSGWYPEYWEYVQMHNAVPPEMTEWLQMMDTVVPRYVEELEADRIFRRRFSESAYERPQSVRAPSPSPSELQIEQQEIDDKNTSDTSG